MATIGYEPYRILWHLFHQTSHLDACVAPCRHPLTPEQFGETKALVGRIAEPRGGGEGSSLLGRFMAEMEPRRLTIGQADLADGLLECLNPFQSYKPFTQMEARGGIYDHFKGGVYKVNGLASWASGDGELVVHYTSLLHGTDHVRFVEQWCEVVQWPDKKFRSRFVWRGPDLTTPAPAYKVPSPVV